MKNKDIKKFDCKYCKYFYYDPNDIKERQKCMVLGMDQKPEINRKAVMIMYSPLSKKLNLYLCEYFDLRS